MFDFLQSVVTLAANVLVAGVCFQGYRRTGLLPLLLLATSDSIAVFALFFGVWLQRSVAYDTASYAMCYYALYALWTTDLVLYAVGIWRLVAWILGRSGESSERGATR